MFQTQLNCSASPSESNNIAPQFDLSKLTREEKLDLLQLLEEKDRRIKGRFISTFYPDTGQFSRAHYQKHIEFFDAGANHRERILIAGNRVGKTIAGAYEVSCHLTGNYPSWWQGKRFDKAVRVWASGDTGKTTRDIVQFKLLGEPGQLGTGMIPREALARVLAKSGVPDAVEIVYVRHVSGGLSTLVFKSYDQRREGFQGTEQDVIWLDEEPPIEVYTECLLRTMTTNGIVVITFTPLIGLTNTVLSFMPGGAIPDKMDGPKHVTMMGWEDAPHLSEKDKEELLASIPLYQRDARSKGIPQLGSGAIYPIAESDIIIDDFPIPDHFARCYAMDVGWNRTAVLWGAYDRDTQTLYLYSEHYRGNAEPIIHAEGIKARGDWIPGVIDPAARGRGQHDGFKLLEAYREFGLQLALADTAVEAGIYKVWSRLSAGKIKVFKSLSNFLSEYRVYRRDEKGNVVKSNDHLMDCLRYLVMTGIDKAEPKPVAPVAKTVYQVAGNRGQGWMGD